PHVSAREINLELAQRIHGRVRILAGLELLATPQDATRLAGAGEPRRGDRPAIAGSHDDGRVVGLQPLDGRRQPARLWMSMRMALPAHAFPPGADQRSRTLR